VHVFSFIALPLTDWTRRRNFSNAPAKSIVVHIMTEVTMFNRKKKLMLALACAGILLTLPHSASAVPILVTAPIAFDPDGPGISPVVAAVTPFNFNAGNALAIGTLPALVGNVQTFVLQTSLKNFASSGATTNFLAPGAEITMTLSASTVITPGPGVSAAVVPNGSNLLKLYYQSLANANPATGTGFDDGSLILSALLQAGTSSVSSFGGIAPRLDTTANTGPPSLNLSGPASTFTGSVVFCDPSFFPSGCAAFVTFTTDLVAPFTAVSPALNFPAFGVVPNLGGTNGLTGPDVQFQANSELIFQRAIPEPSTLSLMSLVLLSLFVRWFPRRPGKQAVC
jgi:hypothetical protein